MEQSPSSSSSSLIFMLIFFSSLIQLHKPTNAGDVNHYQECKKPFRCAGLDNLGYPFYGGANRPGSCGYPGFELNCSGHKPEIFLSSSQKYYLLGYSNTSHTITVSRADYWDTYCPKEIVNTAINFTLFSYSSIDANVSLYYECTTKLAPGSWFSCIDGGGDGYMRLPWQGDRDILSQVCQRNVSIPVNTTAILGTTDMNGLQGALRSGFELKWSAANQPCDECVGSGGVCGSYPNQSKFRCYCADGVDDAKCSVNKFARDNPDTSKNQNSGKSSQKTVINVIAVSLSAVGTGMLIILFFILGKYLKYNQVLWVFQQTNQEIESFLRQCAISGPKRYSYTDLKRITNSFKDKLGGGGYGIVYRGKLDNGQQVAVKVLKKSKENPMDFINEVASIGRTNHKNIVTLLGFCYKGNRRALVYDFMPNGSLDKFIYGEKNHSSLAWEKLFEIAVGIARGLEYLHQGCNTRILHFDIKPHNILLDEDFCPKISDFGLAKSCLQKESIISVSGARGTVGYIAPEVFFRRFGGVSQKSDVYSYGMLVLEMVGCRKKSDAEVECSSEQYFPQWIYKQLEQGELQHPEMLAGEDRELRRKMVLVSLWCIQTNPRNRPTMTRVVEMLEGSSESLEIPPLPTLDSPPRSPSQQGSSTSHTVSAS